MTIFRWQCQKCLRVVEKLLVSQPECLRCRVIFTPVAAEVGTSPLDTSEDQPGRAKL